MLVYIIRHGITKTTNNLKFRFNLSNTNIDMLPLEKLEKLQTDILAFMRLHNNKFDTSKFDKAAKRLQGLLSILQRNSIENDDVVANDLKDSVGKGGANQQTDVRWVQEKLNAKGAKLPTNGQCDKKTIKVIAVFQKKMKEAVTGLIEPGDATYRHLGGTTSISTQQETTDDKTSSNASNEQTESNETTDNPNTLGNTPVSSLQGSVGSGGDNQPEDVRLIKTLLNERINAGLTPDNPNVGPKTTTAIREFQAQVGQMQNSLIEPDSPTWEALNGGDTPDPTLADAPSDESHTSKEGDGGENDTNTGNYQKPPWISKAESYIGTQETGTHVANDPFVSNLFDHLGLLSWAEEQNVTIEDGNWCAAFVSWCLAQSGYRPLQGFNGIRALSYSNSYGTQLGTDRLAYGTLAIFPRRGGGHVGFIVGKQGANILVLGGNQGESSSVCVKAYSTSRLLETVAPPGWNVPEQNYL